MHTTAPPTNFRAASRFQTEAWLTGHASYPGAVETEHGLMLPVTPENLNDLMEFDHVIEVHEDGTVTEPRDIFAPDLEGNPDGRESVEGWTLISDGYTGQDRYHGPIMHNSEQLAGSLAEDILAEPGVYVALVCYWPDDEDTDEGEIYAEGWAVARLDRAS